VKNIRLIIMMPGVISGIFCFAQASLSWKNVSDQFAPLPSTVQVFMSTDSMEGKPNRCFYIAANLKDKNLIFTTQVSNRKRLTPQQFYEEEAKPLLVVNGTFFSFQTNQNLNAIIRDGKLLSFNVPVIKGKNDSLYRYVTRSAIGISRNRKADVAWLFTDTAKPYAMALQKAPSTLSGPDADPSWQQMKKMLHAKNGVQKKWKVETAIGGGPSLISNGEIRITNKEEIMFANGEKDKHPRTAMGYTADGRLIILMTEGRNPGVAEGMTLLQQAQVLKSLGCIEALNLDGGGSSCLLLNGKETIKPSDKEGQRAVPGVFLIYAREN
jgi:Phosphodiester glycosidase